MRVPRWVKRVAVGGLAFVGLLAVVAFASRAWVRRGASGSWRP